MANWFSSLVVVVGVVELSVLPVLADVQRCRGLVFVLDGDA